VNAVYVPFRVPRGQLPGFLDAFGTVPVDGYSVTIPHKEAAAQASHTRDETVTLTRAANTLIRREHGFFAANTDYEAVLDALRSHLSKPDGPPLDLHKRMVLILGAGGVARAVAHALHRAGAIVHIANRTLERAQRLAGEVSAEPLEWTARHKDGCDLVVKCTRAGLHPHLDGSPLHAGCLRPRTAVLVTAHA